MPWRITPSGYRRYGVQRVKQNDHLLRLITLPRHVLVHRPFKQNAARKKSDPISSRNISQILSLLTHSPLSRDFPDLRYTFLALGRRLVHVYVSLFKTAGLTETLTCMREEKHLKNGLFISNTAKCVSREETFYITSFPNTGNRYTKISRLT